MAAGVPQMAVLGREDHSATLSFETQGRLVRTRHDSAAQWATFRIDRLKTHDHPIVELMIRLLIDGQWKAGFVVHDEAGRTIHHSRMFTSTYYVGKWCESMQERYKCGRELGKKLKLPWSLIT